MFLTALLYLPWFLIALFAYLFYRYLQSGFVARDISPKGKAVLVTGAGSGIGKATALQLASLGCRVYAADLSLQHLKTVFAAQSNVECFQCDVTKQSDVDALAAQITARGKGLFAVVNSAGIATPPGQKRVRPRGAAELNYEEDVKIVFDVNVFGTMRINTSVIKLILAADNGVIINIASVAGRLAAKGMSVYCATKHAVVAYSASMRRECRFYNTRVVCIEPGFAKTPILDSSLTPQGADLTGTLFRKTFEDMEKPGRLQEMIGECQSADDVAERIVTAILASKGVAPHLVIDWIGKRAAYTIMSCLPHTWIDAFDQLLNKFV